MIEYSKEELERFAPNDEIIPDLLKVLGSDDLEEQMKHFRKLVLPAVSLLVLKDNMGADWIREQKLNTSEAERVFGSGWMERDGDELAELLYA